MSKGILIKLRDCICDLQILLAMKGCAELTGRKNLIHKLGNIYYEVVSKIKESEK